MKFLFTLFFCFLPTIANGHNLSTSYIDAKLHDDGKIVGNITLKILELKEIVLLDKNVDGELTWRELSQSAAKIGELISKGFSLTRDSTDCTVIISEKLALNDMSNETYVVVPFSGQCKLAGSLTINYNLFFDGSTTHKSVLNLSTSNNEHLLVFTQLNNSINIDVKDGSKIHTFYSFVKQGMYHIAIGFDHILFLLTLLLTVCLVKKQHGWQTISSKKKIIKRTVWIVTSFTLAHSITLSGTALGVIPTMGSWIEVFIAFSILFIAINNLLPLVSRLAVLTFIFGLIHGMGFAPALTEIGLPADQNLLAGAAFNIGVELGQLVLVLVFLPFLIVYRNSLTYRKWIVPCLSLVIACLSIYWIIERLVT